MWSFMGGLSRIASMRCFPAMSSEAVIDHLVGTSFLSFPNSPRDRSLDIPSTSTPDP